MPPQGPDGSCDEHWTAAGGWVQTDITSQPSNNSIFLATGAWDASTKYGYLFGNTDANPVSRVYNSNTDIYVQIADAPSGLWGEGSAVVANGKVWTFGGWTSGATQGNKIYTYDTSQPLNTSGSYIDTGLTLTNAAFDTFCCFDGSKIYLGGGGNQDGPGPAMTGYTQWFSLDPFAGTPALTALTAIPTGTSFAGCAALNGFVYLIGGCLNGGQDTQGVQTVRRYSIAGNSWTTMGDLPVSSAGGRAAVVGGTLYYAAGWNQNGFGGSPDSTKFVYSYNEAGDSWALHSTMEYGAPGSVLGGY